MVHAELSGPTLACLTECCRPATLWSSTMHHLRGVKRQLCLLWHPSDTMNPLLPIQLTCLDIFCTKTNKQTNNSSERTFSLYQEPLLITSQMAKGQSLPTPPQHRRLTLRWGSMLPLSLLLMFLEATTLHHVGVRTPAQIWARTCFQSLHVAVWRFAGKEYFLPLEKHLANLKIFFLL